MKDQVNRNRDSGASAVEYGLLVFGIAATVVLIVFSLGRVMGASYQNSCDTMTSASTTISQTC